MAAKPRSRRILLIEGPSDCADSVRAALGHPSDIAYEVSGVAGVDDALKRLNDQIFDVVLMDLRLSNADSVARLQSAATDLPIVVYGAAADERQALDAVRFGAQDFLQVDQINAITISRSLAYSIERVKVDRMLHDIAYLDSLTGLPNRTCLFDRIQHSLAGAKRRSRHMGILFLNLDGFKAVNDSLGLAAGDDLLQQVGTRLRGVIRECDTVARIGADEFVVLLTDICQSGDAGIVATMLVDLLDQPFKLSGETVCVSVSVGIAVSPHDGLSAEELLRNADAAAFAAKSAGGKGFRYHSSQMNAANVRRLDMAYSIRKALTRNEFVLHYMPIVDAEQNTIGMEALIRWQHPETGLMSPDSFIPDAERMRMIVPIGDWVIQEACRQQGEWQKAGISTGRVSVNLSPHQLTGSDVPATLKQALEENDLTPDSIGLEITETVAMANEQRAIQSLNKLSDMGTRIALDDFGTGYSSLSHLRMLPIDAVKIDRSFVREVTSDPASAAIVKGLILVVQGIGKTVVAEGVETADQLEFLASHGCDSFQGYLFSPGVPAERVPEVIDPEFLVNSEGN